MATPQLNQAQVCEIFGISHMTLWSWRKGTKKMTPLPTVIPRKMLTKPAIRFSGPAITRWARANGVILVRTPEEVLAGKVTNKPGPKPRQQPTAP